jgi:hypothetical protein
LAEESRGALLNKNLGEIHALGVAHGTQ